MANFDPIWNFTLGREGGFQQLKDDVANYCGGNKNTPIVGTKYGISAWAIQGFLGSCPTVEYVRNLTKEQARNIAYQKFWVKSGGEKINNQAIAHLVFQEFFGSAYSGLHRVRKAINQVAGRNAVSETSNTTFNNDPEVIKLLNSLPQKELFDKIWNIAVEARTHMQYGSSYMKRWNAMKQLYYGNFLQQYAQKNNIPSGVVQGIFFGTILLGGVFAGVGIARAIRNSKKMAA